ncbi:MAG: DUF2252 domain-containing protein [Acidobacteriota bacterium]|nr:DUF2252 domain-containing protein [Acidobacteriota bacterium]
MASRQSTVRPNRKERLELGRRARDRVSRGKIGKIESKKRGFDPIEILLESAVGRVARLLPVKYGRMAESPFAFFRGAVSIMAADLARHEHTNLTVQLCGDAHLQNLGSFEAPDGRIVFDLNDFDETIAGPWEWDVKRMAASIVLAGSQAGHSQPECCGAVEAFVISYVGTVEELAEQPVLTAARHQIRRLKKAEATSAAIRQAARAQPLDLLKKYARPGANRSPHFRRVERNLWPVAGARKRDVIAALALYRESLAPEPCHLFDFFRPMDVAFKIVGIGSVGLRDYVVLMEGNGKADPLFLQIKQEVPSAYEGYLKSPPNAHQGTRVANGQRKIQPISDLLLGWTRIGEHDYLVRQLNDHKGSLNLTTLRGEDLSELASIAGELLARGHARSGDALAIKAYIGKPEAVLKGLVSYGLKYADVTYSDYEAFSKAISDNRLTVAR